MKEARKPVVALTGPSGAGKSFLTDRILSCWPGVFDRPVVATTRPTRQGIVEPHRLCMTDDEFDTYVTSGTVVLPHRPFVGEDTPRYGFVKETLSSKKPLLTEVHASLLAPFRELVSMRPVLMIGMLVSPDVLAGNMASRQGGVPDDLYETRLSLAIDEMRAITLARESGVINDVVSYDPHERSTSEAAVIESIERHLKDAA